MNRLIAHRSNIFGDEIAYVESYDFSKANLNDESRLDVITLIASICYQSPKSHGSESLYNRLMAESGGLPSSSFEFVPMLFKKLYLDTIFGITNSYGLVLEDTNILKYGEKIIHDDEEYLLTNFRAVVYDFENLGIDLRDHFNTEAECAIIAKHFKVFKMKVDMPTFGQAVRHRINWQVLSRRYVPGSRVPFSFYIADQMKKVTSSNFLSEKTTDLIYRKDTEIELDVEDLINISLTMYKAALAAGVKPQIARGIIPQCAYTVAWCAFQSKQFDSFINLRTDTHAQPEIQQLSSAMRDIEREKEIFNRMQDYADGKTVLKKKKEIQELIDSCNDSEPGVDA